jgi:hypothetical protein
VKDGGNNDGRPALGECERKPGTTELALGCRLAARLEQTFVSSQPKRTRTPGGTVNTTR